MKTLVLDGTAISIQVAMSTSAATVNPTFVSTYADNAGTGITEGATDGQLNGSTDVTVVPAPTGSSRRVIKDITIYNGDSAPVTIFVKYDNNATQRTIAKVTLAVGDTWTTDGTFDASGSLKQSTGVISLTSQVTGTLPVANGGTGATTLTGVLKGNGTSAFTAATAGTDYLAPPSGTSILKANSGGALANAVAGTDYLAPPSGTAILKANSGGALANATAGTDYVSPTGTETLTNKTLTNPTINNYTEGVVAIGNTGTSQTLSLTNGTVQTATLTGNCTFTMPTATAGKSFLLFLATGAGGFTGTFTGVKWTGGTAPTITTTASKVDILTFTSDGTSWYGTAVQNF